MFKSKNFCHIASNNRNSVKVGVFVYRTTDDLDTITASGYFNERIIDINLHDVIIHEQIDAADNSKITINILSVSQRTADNVETVVALSDWEKSVEDVFVKKDGSSIMSAPLKFVEDSAAGAIGADAQGGIRVYSLDSDDELSDTARLSVKTVVTEALNNGYDIAVPETNSADTLALKSQVDLAANSGDQLYTTGVWYAKMYSATVVPTGAEYDGRNYADFSQVDSENNPIIVIYTGASGAWTETTRITPPAEYNGYITVTSKIWDIAEQTNQQGGQVLWSHNQKTFTPYPRIVSLNDLADINLSNLTDTGKNIANWSSNVTNAIVNIPQDIKLGISSGTLTLKAGSKCYLKTDTTTPSVTIASDLTTTQTTDGTYFAIYDGSDLTTVLTTTYDYSTLPSTYSLPLAIVTVSSGAISSIDQVFNGFGYIGSTPFITPGVKVLFPDGRKADGTLKTGSVTTSTVVTRTFGGAVNNYKLLLSSNGTYIDVDDDYTVAEDGYLYKKSNGIRLWGCVFGIYSSTTGGKIIKFVTNEVFRAVDYTDIEAIHNELDTKANKNLSNVSNNIDYVIATQLPTAGNNYTWYRKYKSGWVEQGGIVTGWSGQEYVGSITLPVTMADTMYSVFVMARSNRGAATDWNFAGGATPKTTTEFSYSVYGVGSSDITTGMCWKAEGMAA